MSSYGHELKQFRRQNKRRESKSYYYRGLGDKVSTQNCCWWETLWLFMMYNISIRNIVLARLMNAPYIAIMMSITPLHFLWCSLGHRLADLQLTYRLVRNLWLLFKTKIRSETDSSAAESTTESRSEWEMLEGKVKPCKRTTSWAWSLTPVIPALGSLRQRGFLESKTSLGY